MFMMRNMYCRMNKPLKSRQGFTLVESLISILVIALVATAGAGLIAHFAKYTRQDLTGTCLMQAASSGLEAKKANPAIHTIDVTCAGQTVYVSMTGNLPSTPPAPGSGSSACADVVSTSILGGRKMEMTDKICSFPEE